MFLEEKKFVRKKISAVINDYSKDWLASNSKIVSKHLIEWFVFKKATKIFGYLSFGNEVIVDEVLKHALVHGKEVFVPYIFEHEDLMLPVRLHSFDDIVFGRYGIRTVKNPEFCKKPGKIDVILTPGLAFTKAGGRMGLGKGYYDRFLPTAENAVKIGVTLTPQVVEELPLAVYDIRVDHLVTENGITEC